MNKDEKQYLCQQVDQVVRRTMLSPKHRAPDFEEFIVETAKAGGRLSLRPALEITAAVATFRPGDYHGRKTLNLREVFEVPVNFTAAQLRAKNDLEFCERKNASILTRLGELKNRIHLGQVKDGVKTIAEVEAWTL